MLNLQLLPAFSVQKNIKIALKSSQFLIQNKQVKSVNLALISSKYYIKIFVINTLFSISKTQCFSKIEKTRKSVYFCPKLQRKSAFPLPFHCTYLQCGLNIQNFQELNLKWSL